MDGRRAPQEVDFEALETPFDGDLVERITETLRRHDPEAEVLPHLLPAVADNKLLSRLGIRGFCFAPLRLPADLARAASRGRTPTDRGSCPPGARAGDRERCRRTVHEGGRTKAGRRPAPARARIGGMTDARGAGARS
ncbi:hypothetical protein AB0E67_11350 [Streptomyces sp. NPDC032161]|uniref:hypothetical protein n=1 Tax=unclassified Streptomyces TaxID=2593676 RepID=UPI0033E1FBD9